MAENNNIYHVIRTGQNSFIEVANNKINGETVTRLAMQIGGSGMSLLLSESEAHELIAALADVTQLRPVIDTLAVIGVELKS